MSTNNPYLLQIDSLLLNLSAEKELLALNAKKLVSKYWHWFNNENTNIAKLRRVGMTELSVSNIAPVLEKRKSGDLLIYYLVWKNHNKQFRSNIKKGCSPKNNASVPIHSYTSKKIRSVLQNRCTWNAPKAIEYENQFELIRVALRGIHDAEVRMRATSRRLNQLNTDTTLGE
jgi:hypothetical protein